MKMTIPQAAKASGRAETTLRSAITDKRLIAEKHGRDWVIQYDHLATYLANWSGRGRPPKSPPMTFGGSDA